MLIQGLRPSLRAAALAPTTKPAPPQAAPAQDRVEVQFSGPRPAHRVVKKLVRTGACLVGAAGAAATAFELAGAPSIGAAIPKALLTLAATGGAVVGMDLTSGLWHHYGDNYGPRAQTLNHVKWHTDTAHTDYCLVGLSNRALDRIGFWPKWEKLLYETTGQEPVSWQVAPYKSFCLGQIDQTRLRQEQTRMGLGGR